MTFPMSRARRLLVRIRHRTALAVRTGLAFLVVLGVVGAAAADILDRPQPRIVNGVLTAEYPTTGALLRGIDADTASAWCSGTLIGCETFLTAGHCVEGHAPSDFRVFLPNAGMFAVASIAQHPDYDFPAADVAVLKLGAPVVGVAPSAILTTSAPPFGSAGVIVGYGRSGDPNFDYGLKRAGSVVTAACSTIPAPGSDTTSVCWNFSNPVGAPGSNSNTCNADSGGPLFVDLGDGPRIAGLTSGGSSSSCLPDDHSYDASVYTYRGFIQTAGGADLANTHCGDVPQVGEAGAVVLTDSGVLGSGNPEGTYTFDVGGGTTLMRVAMNAVDNGGSDYDLYVKFGSAPTTTDYDCGRFGPNQFGVCEFPSPSVGTWHVLVNRFSGSGTYQLTVTEFSNECSGAGTDGDPCDDHNPCTIDDVCQGTTCGGTALDDGTPCEDGNACTGPDVCQAGACVSSNVPNGTPCDDGDPCSRPDTCQAGTCNGTSPAAGCKVAMPRGAYLSIENRSPDTRDRLTWTFHRGSAVTAADLGNPMATTPYTLCLYDGIGGVPVRRVTKAIPPGSHWKKSGRGYRFRDSSLVAAGGLQTIVVTEGAAGRSGLQVRGHGPSLTLPSLPFAHQPNVILQLVSPNACWSSTFSNVDSTQARLRGKSE